MKRQDLENKLIALGWKKSDEASGANHSIWTKSGRRLAVPNYDLIWDSTAERLLEQAQR